MINNIEIYNDDCLNRLDRMKEEGIKATSIITDPPYEIGFMDKKWDNTGIAYNIETWKKCYDVLEAGGYLIAFTSARTYHRIACAIEDAGFRIVDMGEWLYGSGFPKGLDVSKAIDKSFGAEREVIRQQKRPEGRQFAEGKSGFKRGLVNITIPATDLAKEWEGWKTQLKPAHEPFVIAQKPISEKTIAKNIIKYKTGAMNIDACKIGKECEGRYPANIILEDTFTLDEFDKYFKNIPYEELDNDFVFKYNAKASPKERGESNNHPTVKPKALMKYLIKMFNHKEGIVLDPFSGSGTTLVALKELNEEEGYNLTGYGIELNKEYVDIINNRLA